MKGKTHCVFSFLRLSCALFVSPKSFLDYFITSFALSCCSFIRNSSFPFCSLAFKIELKGRKEARQSYWHQQKNEAAAEERSLCASTAEESKKERRKRNKKSRMNECA
jgi:hypothetical protein